ncbi:hypothetical protein KSZ_65870 [Dictyobacter formicarum]|uniref:Tetratricopeptide repeat protein n=1 Tax=Dictyobacter formicarum TaxID=2778368 RepID=A0ABQ3VS89_9CHLR|nr:hypothetical protein KSZ_65870 [Dictyobacter formicarum]
MRQLYGPLKRITEIESYIYEGIGNLQKAEEVCKEYIARYPDDLNMQLRLAMIYGSINYFVFVSAVLLICLFKNI